MLPVVLRSLSAALLVLSIACGDSRPPTAPTPPAQPMTPPASRCAERLGDFPPVSQPARIYVNSDLYRSLGDSCATRYVLFDDGTFELGFLRFAEPTRGTYKEANGLVTFFNWVLSNGEVYPPWVASGVITADSLTVSYNDTMKNVDFEDGVYLRTQ